MSSPFFSLQIISFQSGKVKPVKMLALRVAYIFLALLVITKRTSANLNKQKAPITVTDGNWTNVLDGEWMLEL